MRRLVGVALLLLAQQTSQACKSPSGTCTKICDTGKACGDTCIAANLTCNTPAGTACGGR
jgi:hypothetical protein